MFDIDRWQEIFSSIRSNILRTILSGFTVALGLFIFIVLFGIGNGMKKSFIDDFTGDATNLITIFTKKTSLPFEGLQKNRSIVLTNKDLENIEKNNYDDIEYKTPRYQSNMKVKFGYESGSYAVNGTDEEETKIENRTVSDGRYLSPYDIQNKTKVAVIGRMVQRDLIKSGNPIGKIIDINGINFKVVGVFKDPGGDWDERMISIPLSTMQQMKKGSDTLSTVFLTYNPKLSPQEAIKFSDSLQSQLKKQHKVAPKDEGAVIVRNNAKNMEKTFQFLLVITIIVGVIGGGTLLAGVIGISNIMVYIVKERTKEIGIRKAIGAKPNSIVSLILQESIVITVLSGLIGVIGGVITLKLLGSSLEKYFIKQPDVGWGLIIAAFVSLIVAGSIAGFIPALRASRIKPIEALRTE